MNSIIIVGIIVFAGFIFGELASRVKLPKVTGYIIAGVLLNPDLFHIIPKDFVAHTGLVTNLTLCFITFSVGGTLLYSRIKKLGKSILCITLCEAEFAFIAIVLGFLAITPVFIKIPGASWFTVFIPISLLLGSLGAPTDPSATLAVTHEYNAKGEVSSTIMGVAAFDDALGIITYSVAIVISSVFILHGQFTVYSSILHPLLIITGSVIAGTAFGLIFNVLTRFLKKEKEGALIVLIFGLLTLCFGTAKLLGADELLATMVMGAVVVNYNVRSREIFEMLERYTDELIFVVFFTLSGMHLDFSVLASSIGLVIFFVIFRSAGKVLGTFTGASIGKASHKVKKYTAGGLIPQGGIVIGLALMINQNPAFDKISDIIMSVVIGATIIHELIGPIITTIALRRAGEIKK